MSVPLYDDLFIANLPPDATESDIKELLEPHASVRECWVGHKKQLKGTANTSFSSVRVESHAEAVAAKKALNGSIYKERNLIVKWASNQRLLWVGSLPESVTNEALQAGFSQFGTVERALVVADAQNTCSRRYGFVLFEEKRDAQKALAKCQEGVLLFAKSLEPVRVEWSRIEDAYEGFSDASASGKRRGTDVNPAVVAHLASPGTQEHTMAMRIKQLQMQYEQSKAQLKAQIQAALGSPNMAGNIQQQQQQQQQPMMAPAMNVAPQMMAAPQPQMGGMAPHPMAPPPMQPTGMNMGMMPGGMAPAGNPMGSMGTPMGMAAGSMPMNTGMVGTNQSTPMMGQNAFMSKGMGDSFNSVPPPSKAQMRSTMVQPGYSNNFGTPQMQSGYGTPVGTGMTPQPMGMQFTAAQGTPTMQATMQMQPQQQAPMSGYTAGQGGFGNTTYAPPPQQTSMYG